MQVTIIFLNLNNVVIVHSFTGGPSLPDSPCCPLSPVDPRGPGGPVSP